MSSQLKTLERRKLANRKRAIAAANAEILDQISKRSKFHGITTARGYVETIIDCQGGLCPIQRDTKLTASDLIKSSSSVLVYQNEDMGIIKGNPKTTKDSISGAGLSFDPILNFDIIATSARKDRDGDILHPEGAQVDPYLPMLWQHNPVQPIGKMNKLLSQDKASVKMNCGIADIPLGRDAAYLAQFGALRISHGFRPIKFAPLQGKGETGFEVFEYEMMEVSLVSVPANPDAIILGFTNGNLESDQAKSLGKKLFQNRTVIFKGGIGTGKDQPINQNDPIGSQDTPAPKTDQGGLMEETLKAIVAACATIKHSGGSGHCFTRAAGATKPDAAKPDPNKPAQPDDAVADPSAGDAQNQDSGKSVKQPAGAPDPNAPATKPTDPAPVTDAPKPEPTADDKTGVDVVWNGTKADFEGDAKDADGNPFSTPDQIKDIFAAIPGVTSVQVSSEMQPEWNTGWNCAFPPDLAGPWADSDETEAGTGDGTDNKPQGSNGPGTDQDPNPKPVPPKQVGEITIKTTKSCGCGGKSVLKRPNAAKPKDVAEIETKYTLAVGSSQHTAAMLEQVAGDYFKENKIESGWYSPRVVSVYPDSVIVGFGVYDGWMSESEQASARYYRVGYTIVGTVPAFTGTPKLVQIMTTYVDAPEPDAKTDVVIAADNDGKHVAAMTKTFAILKRTHLLTKKIGKKAMNSLKEAQENLDEAIKGEIKIPAKTLVMRGAQLVKEVLDSDATETPKDDNPMVTDAQNEDLTATTAKPKDVEGTEQLSDETKKSWGPHVCSVWEQLRKSVVTDGINGQIGIALLAGEFSESIKRNTKNDEAKKILNLLVASR
jgi:HK97 family phage prohead protease